MGLVIRTSMFHTSLFSGGRFIISIERIGTHHQYVSGRRYRQPRAPNETDLRSDWDHIIIPCRSTSVTFHQSISPLLLVKQGGEHTFRVVSAWLRLLQLPERSVERCRLRRDIAIYLVIPRA